MEERGPGHCEYTRDDVLYETNIDESLSINIHQRTRLSPVLGFRILTSLVRNGYALKLSVQTYTFLLFLAHKTHMITNLQIRCRCHYHFPSLLRRCPLPPLSGWPNWTKILTPLLHTQYSKEAAKFTN